MMEILSFARAIDAGETGGIGSYEFNQFDGGSRDYATMRRVNDCRARAERMLSATKPKQQETTAIEKIMIDGDLAAIIIRAEHNRSGVQFLTSPDLSQQLAYMHHPAGTKIAPHIHNAVERVVTHTQEALFIRRGSVRVDFYSGEKQYRCSRDLIAGDAILLISGGHGFTALDDLEMIEVKQGPYAGNGDKTVFAPH